MTKVVIEFYGGLKSLELRVMIVTKVYHVAKYLFKQNVNYWSCDQVKGITFRKADKIWSNLTCRTDRFVCISSEIPGDGVKSGFYCHTLTVTASFERYVTLVFVQRRQR